MRIYRPPTLNPLPRFGKARNLALSLSSIAFLISLFSARAALAQLSPAQPSPSQPSPARLSPAQPSQPFSQTKQHPPAPPSTPPPNRTRSGGSLGGESTCAAGNQDLIALVPVENPVYTTADHPTLLFYVPFGAEQVARGEFSLLVGPNETTRLYQTRFTLPPQPGIVSITLPATAEPLKENGSYHWYFKLYCTNSTSSNTSSNATGSADLQVDGWIQRLAHTPDRQRQIAAASAEIWYDALAQVATGLMATPTDSSLQTQWRTLLQQIELEAMATEPLVGAVQVVD